MELQLSDVTAPLMTPAYQAAKVDSSATAKFSLVDRECPPHHRCMSSGRYCAPAAAHRCKACPALHCTRLYYMAVTTVAGPIKWNQHVTYVSALDLQPSRRACSGLPTFHAVTAAWRYLPTDRLEGDSSAASVGASNARTITTLVALGSQMDAIAQTAESRDVARLVCTHASNVACDKMSCWSCSCGLPENLSDC
jgi:hypothetical protein